MTANRVSQGCFYLLLVLKYIGVEDKLSVVIVFGEVQQSNFSVFTIIVYSIFAYYIAVCLYKRLSYDDKMIITTSSDESCLTFSFF